MEHLKRFHNMLNEKQINKLLNTSILIIGCGGVGSYAIESLARSGVKRLIIVDSDIVDISNINRQLCALKSTIGLKKTKVIKDRINDIDSNIDVIEINEFITKENINLLFEYDIDYLIDACDTIETKKEIIRQCIKKNIKFISSMGTGNKLDPSKLEITDISKTSYDPIAKIIRKMIIEEQIKDKIMVISSKEEPIKTNHKEISSNIFIPANAGLLCSSYIINDIIINNKN